MTCHGHRSATANGPPLGGRDTHLEEDASCATRFLPGAGPAPARRIRDRGNGGNGRRPRNIVFLMLEWVS